MKLSELIKEIDPEIVSYSSYGDTKKTVVIWLNGGARLEIDVKEVVPEGQLFPMQEYLKRELVTAVKNTLTKFKVK